MRLSKKLLEKYNAPETLAVVSSFPRKSGVGAEGNVAGNSVARYVHLLLTHFPLDKKVVVFSEKQDQEGKPYEIGDNILVVPAYTRGSKLLSLELSLAARNFGRIYQFHFQFEFSIFGGKESLPAIVAFLSYLKARKCVVSFMFHQVVIDINELAEHLGIKKNGIKTAIFNRLLRGFYSTIGNLSDVVIVHDSQLAKKIKRFINPTKIVVIPHGVGSTTKLSASLRKHTCEQLGFKREDVVIMAFGYQSWYKGSDWIVERVGQIARKHSDKCIRLLLAGGASPTLKDTKAYKHFQASLQKLLDKYNDIVVLTGFIAEDEVAGVFAAADVVVFPYRARMSASGALSLAWQYAKPLLVSEAFSENLLECDVSEVLTHHDVGVGTISFALTEHDFESKLFGLIENERLQKTLGLVGLEIAVRRHWSETALAYLAAIEPLFVPAQALV